MGILTCSGPFCTICLSQSIFTGKKRPVASTVEEIMGNLAKDGLGKVVLEDRGTVFYKCSPIQVEKEALDRYTVDDALYDEKV